MTLVRRARLTVVFSCISLFMGSCTPPPVIADELEQQGRLPPIVLRPGAVSMERDVAPRPSATPGVGNEIFWLSVTSLMTFGIPLLDLPNVLARHRGDESVSPAKCADSWKLVTQRPPWLGSAELRRSALQVLHDAIAADLSKFGRDVSIELAVVGPDDPRASDTLVEIGTRLSAAVLLVADVSFGIEPQKQECAVLMRATVRLHTESLNGPGAAASSTTSATLTEAIPVSVLAWGSDPEVGGRTLQIVLTQLAKDIVQAYRWSDGK